jgi:hypothetical protein
MSDYFTTNPIELLFLMQQIRHHGSSNFITIRGQAVIPSEIRQQFHLLLLGSGQRLCSMIWC